MRKITVYEYDELPTTEAKNKAREWWVKGEASCPAWMKEHFNSKEAVIKRVKAIENDEDFKKLLKDSEKCSLTGYCADALYSDMAKERNITPLPKEVEQYYNKSWDEELNDRLNDKEQIEENIRINNYEFLEDGRWI